MTYILEDIIGRGSDGYVYSLKEENKIIKFIDTQKKINYLELYIMLYLNNIYITKALQIELNLKSLKIVQYKAKEDLYHFLTKNKINNKQKINFIKQIIEGIAFLNSYNIIHGDIKLHNILVYEDSLKITDFNMSRSCDYNKSNKKLYTLLYRPPECNQLEYSLKSDIWALGCTIYEIFYGQPYFEINSQNMIYHLDSKPPDFINKIVKKMIIKDPDKRISIEEVCQYFDLDIMKPKKLILREDLIYKSHHNFKTICYNLDNNKYPIIDQVFYTKYKYNIFVEI